MTTRSGSPSRFLPFAVLSSAVALLLLAPRGAPEPESGDGEAVEAGTTPGTIVVDFVDNLGADEVAAAGERAGVTFRLASDVSADEALYVAKKGGRDRVEMAEYVLRVA